MRPLGNRGLPVERSLIAFALAALLGGAAQAEVAQAPDGNAWLADEDAADRLEGEPQVKAYQALRDNMISGTNGRESPSSVQRERIEAKLALAIRKRTSSNPSTIERRGMAREAARIGEMHVKEDDPERAHAYEKVVESIEPSSPSTSLLRNATREWVRKRMAATLDRKDWKSAQEHMTRWEQLLMEDPSVTEGKEMYARARGKEIQETLGSKQAEQALKVLAEETEFLPGQEAWVESRKAVREGLIQDIDDNKTDLNKMQRAIDRLSKLFPDEASISDYRSEYRVLLRRNRPIPLTRPYGVVKNPQLRIDLAALVGPVEARASGIPAEEGNKLTITAYGEYRLLRQDSKGDLHRVWYGFSVSGTFVDVKDELEEVNATVVFPELLVGFRGNRWAGRIGVGAAIQTYEYDGVVQNFDGTATAIGGGSLAIETSLGQKFSFYFQGNLAGLDEFTYASARAGFRYFPSTNFSISVGGMIFRTHTTPDDGQPELEIETTGILVGAVMQF